MIKRYALCFDASVSGAILPYIFADYQVCIYSKSVGWFGTIHIGVIHH